MKNEVMCLLLITLTIFAFIYIYRHSTIVGNSIILDFGREKEADNIEEIKEKPVEKIEENKEEDIVEKSEEDKNLLFYLLGFTFISSFILMILLKYLKRLSLEIKSIKKHNHSTWLE